MSTVSKPMSNVHRYGISSRNLFIRNPFWPLLIPSITILFLVFTPHLSSALKVTPNENPDRTVANLSPRELQLSSTDQRSVYSQDHTLYVITVDGKITAMDARAQGRRMWTADTGSPLIDSSLSKIEITRDSRSVRLIPSLIGGLYEKYEEDGHVEPLSFDADALLDASFKLHDDLVITGGKHIDTLGLDMQTGQILYGFSKDESKDGRTNTDTNSSRATLIVKRKTQTVRARSVRNGYEKWNFSVSNHELLYLHGSPTNIIVEPVDHRDYVSSFSGYFVYQLQTGVVQAFDAMGQELWSTSADAPIAAVWELKNGQLKEKSLFETSVSPSSNEPSTPPLTSRRLAFVGEFNSTPYVLVSPRVQKQLIQDARRIAGYPPHSTHSHRRHSLSPWQKAYQKRTVSIDAEIPENHYPRSIGMETSDRNYPLALRRDSNSDSSRTLKTCDTEGYLEITADLADEDDEERNGAVSMNKENGTGRIIAATVTLSSVVLGAFFLGLWYHKKKPKETLRQNSTMTETTLIVETTPPSTPDYYQLETPTPPFQSRYAVEYEHVRLLGRGGFGVVFEAINKLDERRVAIKRVSLKKASGKERALKEIRYLAVLNHPNLIQYFYAWNETPPPGWQDEQDKTLLVKPNQTARDSISGFPTSTGNDSESVPAEKSSIKRPVISPSPLLDFTFDRSSNPLRIREDFSNPSLSHPVPSESNSTSEDHLDTNNNRSKKRTRLSTTTKSSASSSSPFFEPSTSSDDEDLSEEEEKVEHEEEEGPDESDGGIVFLGEEKASSMDKTDSKLLVERKSLEKETPTTYFYFVMELCRPETLKDRLIQRTVSRAEAWSIFDQIVHGIEYIHSQKLIHRDLKPSNILFSLDNTVRIGDFGLVSAFGEEKSSKKKERVEKSFQVDTVSFASDIDGNHEMGGTALYMSPEQINRQSYNQKVDIYAMGIILFELLYPFSTQMERIRAIEKVRLEHPIFPTDFEPTKSNHNQQICQFLRWLLCHSPRDRPRASELRQEKIYQTILQRELPQFLSVSDLRLARSTLVHTPEQISPGGRVRNSSSPFHRSHSSFSFQSHRDSDSAEMK